MTNDELLESSEVDRLRAALAECKSALQLAESVLAASATAGDGEAMVAVEKARAALAFVPKSQAATIDGTRTAAVDREYHWRPMSSCPKGAKVQLVTRYGCAIYGAWNGRDPIFEGWAPLPTRKPKSVCVQ